MKKAPELVFKSNFRLLPLAFILSVLFASCNSDSEIKSQLAGDWQILPTEDFELLPFPQNPFGFSISGDSITFFLPRTRIVPEGNVLKDIFFQFKIKEDSIFVENPQKTEFTFWSVFQKRSGDTLFLQSEDGPAKFSLIPAPSHPKNQFDQIVLSRSGCYGKCPVYDISLTQNGEMLYRGTNFVEQEGLFEGNLNKASTDYIFSKFQKINLSELEENYSVDMTDSEEITTTFLKNGKIVHTVSDYANAGPALLRWAYFPMFLSIGEAELKRTDSLESPDLGLPNFKFSSDSIQISLSNSESWFLATELRGARPSQKDFSPDFCLKHTIMFYPQLVDETQKRAELSPLITTDGRFYQFKYPDKTQTYDLGYNFLKRNFPEEHSQTRK